MRIYLPSTFPELASALAAGELGSPPICAFAVTLALREWYASGDLEELEYAAMTSAARGSLRMLAAGAVSQPRRVVIAAEIPLEAVSRGSSDIDRAAVVVGTAIPLDKVISAHIDDPAAASDVSAAIDALAAADKGDDDARFIVDGAEGHELLWYGASELPYLF